MGKNHKFMTNTYLLISVYKWQMAEAELLPFVGKTNVMLNLSIISNGGLLHATF